MHLMGGGEEGRWHVSNLVCYAQSAITTTFRNGLYNKYPNPPTHPKKLIPPLSLILSFSKHFFFCTLTKGITPEICTLRFVLINSVLFNLLYVGILSFSDRAQTKTHTLIPQYSVTQNEHDWGQRLGGGGGGVEAGRWNGGGGEG